MGVSGVNKTPKTKAKKSKNHLGNQNGGTSKNFTKEEFLRVKNSLLSFYQNIASAQAVRLIGFTAGVFTLIGATQISPEQHLRNFFSGAGISHLIEGIHPAIVSNIKFFFLFGSMLILFFFIFRAIFRYTSYAYLASALIYLSMEETEKADGQSLHNKIVNALLEHVENHPRKVFMIPIWYFIKCSKKTNVWWGIALSFVLSVFATTLLLLLLW